MRKSRAAVLYGGESLLWPRSVTCGAGAGVSHEAEPADHRPRQRRVLCGHLLPVPHAG